MPRRRRRPDDEPEHPLATYLREINETALLSADEEKAIGLRIHDGDPEARDRMIRANLRLVVNIARGYIGKGLDLQDFIEESNLGLLVAVEAFDPTRAIRFSTYAATWIKQAISRSIKNSANDPRRPPDAAAQRAPCPFFSSQMFAAANDRGSDCDRFRAHGDEFAVESRGRAADNVGTIPHFPFRDARCLEDDIHRWFHAPLVAAVLCLLGGTSTGCNHPQRISYPTPAASGLNTRDLIDPVAQVEADESNPTAQLAAAAERVRTDRQQKLSNQSRTEGGPAATQPNRSILCLSGGGSSGAYAAGVLVGWTEHGDRPTFDVVTGVSTGALIAPSAFLGPKYDDALKQFFTTVESKDIYTVRPFWGLFDESYADTSPLAARIDAFLTPQVMQDLAEAHRSGRRLYIGTTEEEGRQFVIWDIGAMAVRNGPGDRELIGKVLLASTAAPGFFPAVRIDVTVDGRPHTERHVDGGVSQALFYRPPYVAASDRSNVAARDMAGTKAYVIVAGKLYADPEMIRPWSLNQGGNISTLIYAQTRGDLQRLYTVCLLTGMDYYVSAIPNDYPVPTSSAEFKRVEMTALFEAGRGVLFSANPWRTLPPGVGPGESTLARVGPSLTYRPRGPLLPISGPQGIRIPPRPFSNGENLQAVPPGPLVK